MTTTTTCASPGDSNDGSPGRSGLTASRRSLRGRRARSLLAGGLVVGLVFVMTACSRSSGGASSGSSSTSTGSGTSSGAPFNGQFGSLTTPVCGPLSTPTPAPTKAQVGATSGINVKGVTASNIRIGTISDTGYVGSPGLNQELWDASDVFVDWCNSLGGINGHKIQLDKLDSKITQYKQVVQTACTQDFALVGGGAVFDNTAETDRLKCLLPNYPGFLVTAEARGSDLSVQASNADTNSAVNFGIARYLSTTFPASSSSVGYLAPNLASLITLKNQFKEAGTHFGWKTTYDQSYNALGEASWVPFAQSLKTKGVKGLLWTGEPDTLGKLVAALGQVDYKLDWIAAVSNAAEPQLIERGRRVHQAQQRVRPGPLHTLPRHGCAGDQPVRATVRQVPPPRQEQGHAGAQQLLGVAAVRPGGEGLRGHHHEALRLQQREPHEVMERCRAHGAAQPLAHGGPDRVLRGAQGRRFRRLDDRLARQRRALQLRPAQRGPAQGELRDRDQAVVRRKEHVRPQLTP